MSKIRVTIWNEYYHEREEAEIAARFPNGIHECLKSFLSEDPELEIRTATLDEPENGLTQEVIDNTDVLVWWGHMKHGKVKDEVVERIRQAVFGRGMGFVPLHSGHQSKPFQAVLGTLGNLQWGRNQKEVIWNLLPQHPIAEGIPMSFVLPLEEMYGEPFSIPTPDELVFGGWFEDGYIFRSGCCWYRGNGKVFYFQPGHEEADSFYNPTVQKIIRNGIHWAAPAKFTGEIMKSCRHATEVY